MSGPLALITGSCGLIGLEMCFYFDRLGFRITGIDNNQRAIFFGPEGDTSWMLQRLRDELDGYSHYSVDIRDRERVLSLFSELKPAVIIHTAAQPSHDRAASIPFDDFDVNAVGTLNLLEATAFLCGFAVHSHVHQQGLRRLTEPRSVARAWTHAGTLMIRTLLMAYRKTSIKVASGTTFATTVICAR